MNANECFEENAGRFYRATGMLAPGKDDRSNSHSRENRKARWDKWAVEHFKCHCVHGAGK